MRRRPLSVRCHKRPATAEVRHRRPAPRGSPVTVKGCGSPAPRCALVRHGRAPGQARPRHARGVARVRAGRSAALIGWLAGAGRGGRAAAPSCGSAPGGAARSFCRRHHGPHARSRVSGRRPGGSGSPRVLGGRRGRVREQKACSGERGGVRGEGRGGPAAAELWRRCGKAWVGAEARVLSVGPGRQRYLWRSVWLPVPARSVGVRRCLQVRGGRPQASAGPAWHGLAGDACGRRAYSGPGRRRALAGPAERVFFLPQEGPVPVGLALQTQRAYGKYLPRPLRASAGPGGGLGAFSAGPAPRSGA